MDTECEPTKIDRLFALNRFNFDAARAYLIPRAVAYSAGLINHFFRGKLSIHRPDQYFYIDHESLSKNSKGTTTFTRIQLKLRNETPAIGGVSQDMAGGELRLVLHDGGTRYVSKSLSLGKTTLTANTDAQPFTFTFTEAVPLPSGAVKLQVVYKGKLGSEDAVAATMEDLPGLSVLHPGPPAEGVYAVVDHAVTHHIDDGFKRFKLRLTQEGNGPLPSATGGELQARVMYLRDLCYQPDLSGEYKPSDYGEGLVRWNNCTTGFSFGENSTAQRALAWDELGQDIALDFSAQPIPINAEGVYLYLSYRFQYPRSDNGDHVTQAEGELAWLEDISEPTYFSLLNSRDYTLVNGVYYSMAELLAEIAAGSEVGRVIDLNSDNKYGAGDWLIDPLPMRDIAV